MDETPNSQPDRSESPSGALLPVERESFGVEVPVASLADPVTAGTLWRDAIVDLVGALGLGIVIVLLIASVVAITKGKAAASELTGSAWGIAGLLLATEIPLLLLGLRRRRRNRQKNRPVFPWFGPRGGNAILRGIAGGFAIVVLSALYSAVVERLFGEGSVDNRLEFLEQVLNDKAGVALLAVLIAIVAPVCEEVFFRGAIYSPARAAGLNGMGALISALLFSLVHFSLLLAPYYALVALLLCWLYARTGTLTAPIVAHMTLNGVACVALIAAKS